MSAFAVGWASVLWHHGEQGEKEKVGKRENKKNLIRHHPDCGPAKVNKVVYESAEGNRGKRPGTMGQKGGDTGLSATGGPEKICTIIHVGQVFLADFGRAEKGTPNRQKKGLGRQEFTVAPMRNSRGNGKNLGGR